MINVLYTFDSGREKGDVVPRLLCAGVDADALTVDNRSVCWVMTEENPLLDAD